MTTNNRQLVDGDFEEYHPHDIPSNESTGEDAHKMRSDSMDNEDAVNNVVEKNVNKDDGAVVGFTLENTPKTVTAEDMNRVQQNYDKKLDRKHKKGTTKEKKSSPFVEEQEEKGSNHEILIAFMGGVHVMIFH